MTSSIAGNIEFHVMEVHKGNALHQLAEKLKIPKSRCIAFGDNENDLEMFQESETAVAMANAETWIQEKAEVFATKLALQNILERYKLYGLLD